MYKFLFIVFTIFAAQAVNAQAPNWSVEVSNYQYSMTFTTFLNVNGNTLTSENDQVAAFVDGEIRGVSNVVYVSSAKKYVAYLTVYANTNSETIDFEIYNSANGTTIATTKTEVFKIDENKGGIFQSYSIASPALSGSAVFTSFKFLEVTEKSVTISEDNIAIVVPEDTDITSLTPVFTSSTNSKVFIARQAQESGTTSYDFTSKITYQVLSENEANFRSYEVAVSKAINDDPVTVVISNASNVNTNLIPVSLNVTFSKAVSGFKKSDIELENGVVSSFTTTDSQNYKVDIIPISQGLFNAQIASETAFDENNNQNEISNKIEFNYDILKPLISDISVSTDANSRSFLVTFNEAVLNVDSDDFQLKGAGSSTLAVSAVSKITDNQYKVTVSNQNTEIGVIALQLNKGSDIKDAAGNEVIVTNFEAYFIIDKETPNKTRNYLPNYDFETWVNRFSLNSWLLDNGNNDGTTYSFITKETRETSSQFSATAIDYYVTEKGKGFLRTILPITIDENGRYFFSVWVKATAIGDKIDIGVLKNDVFLTDTYIAENTDWNFVVKYIDAVKLDVFTPVIIPNTVDALFYIDDVSFGQGLGGQNVEWDVVNEIPTSYDTFFEIEAENGINYAEISETFNPLDIHGGNTALQVVTTTSADSTNRGILSFKQNTTIGNRYQHPKDTKGEYQAAVWVKPETTADIYIALVADGVQKISAKITLAPNKWTQVFSPVIQTDGLNASEIEIYPKLYFSSANTSYYVDDFYLNWGVLGTLSNSVWYGNIDTNWDTAGNWNTGILPLDKDNIYIPAGLVNYPTVADESAISIHNIVMESGSSLIANNSATISGSLTYNLEIEDTNWHLISSPVVGEQYDDDWIAINGIAFGNIASSNRGISTYDNTRIDATTENWRYFQAGGTAESYDAGVGYALLRKTFGNYSFIGAFPSNNVLVPISRNENNWNLIGNPYPSYLDVDKFLTANAANLTDSYEAVYVFDGINYRGLTTGYIHPGQAFFVNSNVSSGNATIEEKMQSHQTGGKFYKNLVPAINLIIKVEDKVKSTQLVFLKNKTLGLDVRFDLGLFQGVHSDLSIYTELVEDNLGVNLSRQALPDSHLYASVVPVGVKVAAQTEIIFSLNNSEVPDDITILLEDRLMNSFTRLDAIGSDYKITTSEDLDGVGRFYLHTSNSVLSTDNQFSRNTVKLYQTDVNTLAITGLPEGVVSISIYSILGKQLLHKSFNTSGATNIILPKISKGLYMVQLSSTNFKLNKKIILK